MVAMEINNALFVTTLGLAGVLTLLGDENHWLGIGVTKMRSWLPCAQGSR